ncbi:hypothetical protein [Lysinibacillus sphaericus]|uniref:Uncharacterized protein n=1 Tax=Lysinibacillus sphaericus OT4b.31 TaxID=1285586 RepID=R7ZIG2_LYSSH|nr:hypothetical protein [Lysinibacillus sphaericus]EON73846.1 hypothetical protein H131_04254 [Lysinibacillus sphaericus OT4b.31]
MSKAIDFSEAYAFTANTIGEMLVMKVVHKLTGVAIYTKRKKILNKAHLRGEIYSFREYLFERNGLEQIVLDSLAKEHEIDTSGKNLRGILDKISALQDNKRYIDVTSEEVQHMHEEVDDGKHLGEVLKAMGKTKSKRVAALK